MSSYDWLSGQLSIICLQSCPHCMTCSLSLLLHWCYALELDKSATTSRLAAPHRSPTPTSKKGTPAMQVLVVWTKDVGDFGFSSKDRALAFKVIRLVGQAAGF